MPLTDAQIERYSRQIIVPHVGGRGQERIIAARVILAGEAPDVEAPLAYLVGAGVSTIFVLPSQSSASESIARMRSLNPEVTVAALPDSAPGVDLALVIIGSADATQVARSVVDRIAANAFVTARLDVPGKIVVLPTRSPCPRCADAARLLEANFGARSEAAEFIAMLATAEAFKLVAGYAENPAPASIEFAGYATSVRSVTASAECPCARNPPSP
jgi:adenylyltransferase/sulfurtransferase